MPLRVEFIQDRRNPDDIVTNHFVCLTPYANGDIVEVDPLKSHTLVRGNWTGQPAGFVTGVANVLRQKYTGKTADAMGYVFALVPK